MIGPLRFIYGFVVLFMSFWIKIRPTKTEIQRPLIISDGPFKRGFWPIKYLNGLCEVGSGLLRIINGLIWGLLIYFGYKIRPNKREMQIH